MLFDNSTIGKYANSGNTVAYKVTPVKNVAKDLSSIDDLFAQQNFNVCLRRPSYENGISEISRQATKDSEDISYKMRNFGASLMFYLIYESYSSITAA